MKKSGNKTLFFIIILGVCIVIIGLFAGQISPETSIQDQENTNKANENDNSLDSFEGTIVYLAKSSDENNIGAISKNNEAKTIFTDKDEDLKIKSAASITAKGKVLALMASGNQEFGGSLFLIDVANPGSKEKLMDQFASTQPPVISPNGKKIAYLLFSNVETDYGFSLYIMDSDGKNKQKLTGDPTNLKILSWNPESTKISYLKGDASKESIINYYDINTNKEDKITSFKEKLYFLNWNSHNIIFSKGPTQESDINKAEIYKMDTDGKNLKRLTTNEEHDSFCFVSPDGKIFTYLENNYEKNVDTNKSGGLFIQGLNSDKNKNLIEANSIIGWIN